MYAGGTGKILFFAFHYFFVLTLQTFRHLVSYFLSENCVYLRARVVETVWRKCIPSYSRGRSIHYLHQIYSFVLPFTKV